MGSGVLGQLGEKVRGHREPWVLPTEENPASQQGQSGPLRWGLVPSLQLAFQTPVHESVGGWESRMSSGKKPLGLCGFVAIYSSSCFFSSPKHFSQCLASSSYASSIVC